MPALRPKLIATCWTIAGDIVPDTADNVSRWPLEDRIDAAARAGYDGIGFWLGDLLQWRDQGKGYADLRAHLSDAGLRIVELEFLADWFTHGERRARSDEARAELFRAADALGARHMKVMPPFGGKGWDGGWLAEQFAGLCADAARHGLIIGMEMIPFSDLPNLPSSLDMVARADAANGGLLIDIWHVVRSGGTVADAGEVPLRFIKAVELCDADRVMHGSITEDTMHHRRLCGMGDFDLAGFIGALDHAGYDGPFGVEILSRSFRKLPLEDAAGTSFATAAALFGEQSPG